MTRQTLAPIPHKARRLCLSLVQYVENRSLLRINGRDFNDTTTRYPANIDTLVEVQSPWMNWRNPTLLKAGFGKDQHLRRNWNVQFVKHGSQIAMLLFILQFHVAADDSLL
jgi:hypothetical protein